jgi:hypothetical protein
LPGIGTGRFHNRCLYLAGLYRGSFQDRGCRECVYWPSVLRLKLGQPLPNQKSLLLPSDSE